MHYIYLDMDGVIANFTEGFCTYTGIKLHHDHVANWDTIVERTGLTHDSFDDLLQTMPASFWSNLEPYEWAHDLVNVVEHFTHSNDYKLLVVTAAVIAEETFAGKKRWLDRHFPSLTQNIRFLKEKHLLGRPHHILIDDFDGHCEGFTRNGGTGLVFPQPWNSQRDYIQDRVGVIRDALAYHPQGVGK